MRKQASFFLLLLLALVAALGAGLLTRQVDFLTRGVFDLNDPVIDDSWHGGPQLGVVIDLSQYDSVELVDNLQKIEGLGITQIRQSYFYSPQFDWAAADAQFAALERFPSIQLVPLLDGNPADNYAPVEPMEFAAWTAEFAQRYGDEVEAYIIWDEPNITTHWGNGEINPQSYAAILSAASAAIRNVDPTAQIVLAPLAPTTENNLINMAESRYLQELYGAGAADTFDIVAVKPYGFDDSPTDRTTKQTKLNFSRAILVRETMVAHGDGDKPIWAANWGWNSLPDQWSGPDSPWGEVSSDDHIDYTQAGFRRATAEWPWVGTMFLHHWSPVLSGADDPAVGFSLSQQSDLSWVKSITSEENPAVARSGFYPATPNLAAAEWLGDWRFSPEFGADMSEKLDGDNPDQVIFHFDGTDVGLRVRRANYRARFNILIDGEPANALPIDDRTADYGSALVLNTNSPDEDQVETITVATGLDAGPHEMVMTGFRGWDQWALKGFVVANRPDIRPLENLRTGLAILATVFGLGAIALFKPAGIGQLFLKIIPNNLSEKGYLWLSGLAGLLVALTGWLTWGATAEGLFRRMNDGTQLAVVFGTAIIFYITPWLPLYLLALVFLFVLIYQRPILGLVLITFSIPFYVPQLLKPIYRYRFSPVEIFMLVTFGALLLKSSMGRLARWASDDSAASSRHSRRVNSATKTGNMINHVGLSVADLGIALLLVVSCVSLAFTERLGVATNELRTVIIGPTAFYWMVRKTDLKPNELRWLIWAFVGGGLLVALIGLGQYVVGDNLITAEGGLQRLRSIYGSPNNVALYLGRIFPILSALVLAAILKDGLLSGLKSAWLASLCLFIITAAMLLSFSRGGILLGLPFAAAVVLIHFQKRRNRPVWPWLAAGLGAVALGYLAALQIPSLAGRLTLSGQTAGFRINLWLSSWQIIQENPWTGVGLDNFLYTYRNRYILARAWQEPNLNHPHNHILDFTTRLGLFGLIAGILIFWGAVKNIMLKFQQQLSMQQWGFWVGLAGSVTYILAHGLVDHSFFLIDLAYSTCFIVAISHLHQSFAAEF